MNDKKVFLCCKDKNSCGVIDDAAVAGGTDGTGGGGSTGDAAGLNSDVKIATDGTRDQAILNDGPSSSGGSGGGSFGGNGATSVSSGGVGGNSGGVGGGDGGSGGGGGTVVGSGGTVISDGGGGPDALLATPDSPLAAGATCSVSSDCASNSCVDGVCCDKAFAGCNACKQTLTGKADGTCAPVSTGQDPHNTCTDEIATNPCGNDGTCDGAGACHKVGVGQSCGKGSCSSTGSTQIELWKVGSPILANGIILLNYTSVCGSTHV